MDLDLLSFKQLVSLFLSLGPHKHRELAAFAGTSHEVVAQWGEGTGRPNRSTETHLRHYLLSKLSDISQLRKDHEAQTRDLTAAEAKLKSATSTWDLYIESLREEGATEETLKNAEASKERALRVLRGRLGLA